MCTKYQIPRSKARRCGRYKQTQLEKDGSLAQIYKKPQALSSQEDNSSKTGGSHNLTQYALKLPNSYLVHQRDQLIQRKRTVAIIMCEAHKRNPILRDGKKQANRWKVRNEPGFQAIETKIEQRSLERLGHLIRLPDDSRVERITFGWLCKMEKLEKHRTYYQNIRRY